MKILICTGIYPPDIGGPATYSKLLFDELPQKGVDVEVLSFGEVRHLPKILRHIVYFILVLKTGRRVDLIYAQDPVSVGFPSFLASKILGKKFILKIVGDYAWEQYQQSRALLKFLIFNFQFSKSKEEKFVTPEKFQTGNYNIVTNMRRWVERFVGKNADKIVVPSNYLKEIVIMWGVNLEKIKVIYNAFAPNEILESREGLRKKFNFDAPNLGGEQEKIIFSVGRLVPWKGFELLIEVVKGIPNTKLLIAGDGPDKEKLQEKIKSLDLNDRVKLVGRLEQNKLLKQIKASDLFVLNTGYEGLSHQLLEVMAVGTPIITTNVGGNPEIIENNKEGLLVPYNNKEELKEAIMKLLGYNEIREDFVRNAREKVKSFNKEKMLGEISEFLKNF